MKLCYGSSGRNFGWSLSRGVAVLSAFVFTLMITIIVTFPSHSALYNPFSAVLMVQGSIILSEKNRLGYARTKVLFTTYHSDTSENFYHKTTHKHHFVKLIESFVEFSPLTQICRCVRQLFCDDDLMERWAV